MRKNQRQKRYDGQVPMMFAICMVGLSVISCKTEPKAKSEPVTKTPPAANTSASAADSGTASLAYTPGEAGGVAERVVHATATVSAVDVASRKITLTTPDGEQGTYIASPEIRNLDQLRVGDKVNATLKEQLTVLVGPKRELSASHAAVVARAPKGAKPGAMVAEVFEVVGEVAAIDKATRTATLRFKDGQTAPVAIRPDVDLSKYKVGDSVTIRVTQQLSLLAANP